MAGRIILELSDKKDFLADFKDLAIILDVSSDEILKDAAAALEKLGYSEKQIKNTLRKVIERSGEIESVETVIKESLSILSS